MVVMVGFGATAADVGPIAGNPLIEIPAGAFVFGRNDGLENEHPRQRIEGQGFAINRTEITNGQYRRFVGATGRRPAFYASHPLLGLDNRPVVGVSWADANAFCRYYGLALPSEQQYERAARGTAGAAFPWGAAAPDATKANAGAKICCSGDESDGYSMTAPAESFAEGASEEGVLNLVGNVWEWTSGVYAPYGSAATATSAGTYRVLRGGSWNSDPKHLTTTYRLAYDPEFRFSANGGFRCVRSAP
ncbi:formylglycine-generating enzyme family protein [Mycoplana sp. BE70]|uniref:formylglycine-generating enzyme family protein n=1 Tax=Mycoplana sp. BE70 TaxID=2817775 RepID=UPI00286B2E34|nr:formylglycine-generating enzyme family protein [Mycoplana sp. BE70]